MPSAETTKWIKVDDFSPGIIQATTDATSTPQPLGSAASVDNANNPVTFDCISFPGGALGAAPFNFFGGFKRLAPNPTPDFANLRSAAYASALLHVRPFLVDGKEMIYYGYNYNLLSGGNNRRRLRVFYDLYNSIGGATAEIELQSPAAVTPLYTSPGPITNIGIYGFGSITEYRSSSPAAATIPGTPSVIIGFHDPSQRSATTWKHDAVGLGPTIAYVAINDCEHLVSHQGRLLVNGNHVQYLVALFAAVHNDDFFWTIPNQDGLDNGGADSSFSQASLGSYGIIVAQSASELLIVRTTPNGGITVSSDLNDPIVTDYAAMQGTNGCHVEGCWTPAGYLFPALDSSVYMYVGGGQTQDIAQQMDWGFWNEFMPDDVGQAAYNFSAGNRQIIPQMGKCAYISDYALVPGNWLYQLSGKSWWRFRTPNNTTDLQHNFNGKYFATGPNGNMYVLPDKWASPGADYLLCQSLFNSPAAAWAWQSNLIPIAEGSDFGEVREFIVEGVSYGTGTDVDNLFVKITVYPSGEVYTFPGYTFNLALDSSEAFRSNTPSLKGTHATVTLFAVNTPGAGPTKRAPTVLNWQLGVGPGTKIVGT